MNEDIEIKSALTIEHIMPRKWKEHWPVPGVENSEDGALDLDRILCEGERERSVDKLGNLTLLTHSLNASISNGAFETKMPQLRAHASLALNREIHAFQQWDETMIDQRGAALFEIARKL